MTDPRSKTVPAEWLTPIEGWRVAMVAASRSPQTIATRTDHLRRAARALNGNPWEVTTAQLVDWCGRQTWTAETRRSVRASLRQFWAWGVDAGHVDVSPAVGLPTVVASAPRPRPAPDEVIDAAATEADPRVRFILTMAARLGLRRAEISRIHAHDLVPDLVGWSLRVQGKGNRERVLPLTAELAVLIRSQCAGGWALPGDDNGHLSPRWVGKLATRALPGDWTLHTLRHRFGTTVHNRTHDLRVVQELLGHASVATTQRYVAVENDALRQAVAAAA